MITIGIFFQRSPIADINSLVKVLFASCHYLIFIAMAAYRSLSPALSLTQLDNPNDKAKLSNCRKLNDLRISHAEPNSQREFSASSVLPRAFQPYASARALTRSLDQQPMITLPFSYHVGGALSWNDPTYIKRRADSELLNAIQERQFAYVLAPRQMGKSSLRIQTRHQLIQQGYRCVTVQASQIRSLSPASAELEPTALATTPPTALAPPNTNLEKECSAFISTLWTQLNVSSAISLREWLSDTRGLPVSERLSRFGRDILASELITTPIVVFIDEIDALLTTSFLAYLLQWIEQCNSSDLPKDALPKDDYLHRTKKPYKNLTFVLLGTTSVSELCQPETDHMHSQPSNASINRLFANGCQISLPTFQVVETFSLHQGFKEKIEQPSILLKAIFKWTQGQPFLTQKLCQIASTLIDTLLRPSSQPIVLSTNTINAWIDNLVRSHIIKHWRVKDAPIHFRAIRDRLIYSPHHKALLNLYKTILHGIPTRFENTPLQAELLLTGIVTIIDNQLHIANPIYREIFSVKG